MEPFVRHRWPHALITWNRILEGQLKDSLVGRDVLVGIFFAALLSAVRTSFVLLEAVEPTIPEAGLMDAIQSTPGALAFLLGILFDSANISLALFFLFSFFRAVLRKQWIATVVWVILVNVISNVGLGSFAVPQVSGLVISSVFAGLWLVGVMRYGLTAGIAMWFADRVFRAAIMIAPQGWYAGRIYLVLGALAALSIYAFRKSVGKRSPLSVQLMSGKE